METDTPASAGTDQAAGAPAPEVKAAPVEVLAPKERRRRRRAARAPGQRGPTTPEERQAERDALRVAKARQRRTTRLKTREKARAAAAAAPTPAPDAPVAVHVAGAAKVRQGIVVSAKAAKTITVRVDTSRRHRRYQKIVRSSKTLHAHDEHDEAHEGDLVRVVEARPMSKTKRWRLTAVLERAK
jgi:small subunit ribosomal protein S17